MRLPSFFLLLLSLPILWTSCREDFEYDNSSGQLQFSKDTVYLDTIFSNIGSSTYSLKVYNHTDRDIQIPNIGLGEGGDSKYRLNIDGVAGKEFYNIPLLAKDSLYIFIETTFDMASVPENTYLYTDLLLFNSGTSQQKIPLVTLVRDAIFLYPKRLPDGSKETIVMGTDDTGKEIRSEGFELLDSQLNFTNEKPYVVYGYAVVPKDKTLTMEAGTRVYFHKDSGISVDTGASMKINGTLSDDPKLLEKEVVFEGDRLEPEYTNITGQWGAIWLTAGSKENVIDHLTIRNASIGLIVEGDGKLETPTLEVKNSQIYNSSNIGLWTKNAFILGYNLVLGNAGQASLYCHLGGKYSFAHCTIANYWSQGYTNGIALKIDNYSSSSNNDLTNANFSNCIIDGINSSEILLDSNDTNTFSFTFANCMIKSTENSPSNSIYDFTNESHYKNILLNLDPDFMDGQNNNFQIRELSMGIGKGNLKTAFLLPMDISGADRTTSPDIGAYEYVPNKVK